MKLSQRLFRDLSLLLFCLVIFGLGAWLVAPTPSPRVVLKISAGSAVGTRHALAMQLKDICRAHKLELELVATDGSEHALRELDNGQLDLAFIQGGMVGQSYPHVTQIAPLHLEPLHLLVKPQLAAVIEEEGLGALGGHTINTGADGSGTQALAVALLRFLGLQTVQTGAAPPGFTDSSSSSYQATELSYDQLLELPSVADLPDAVFSTSSLPSAFAKEMIERHGFELVELPFSDAFALDAFDDRAIVSEPSAAQTGKYFDQSRVFPVTIPAFTYSVRRRQPPKALDTIGTRLLLVANARVPDAVVERLLTVLFDSAITKNSRPPLDVNIMESAPEFAWHSGARAFISHHKPLIAGAFVELTANGLAIAGSVLGGSYVFIQWFRRRRQHGSETEFRGYLNAVLDVERQLLDIDSRGAIQISDLVKLHQRLIELKREVAQRFFNGELEGQTLMLGFMTMTNDVRNHIARLMLHERENIEELASQEHQSVESLWDDRLKSTES